MYFYQKLENIGIYILILVQVSREYLISEHYFRVNLFYLKITIDRLIYFRDFFKIMSKRPNFWASLYPKFEVLSQNRQNIVRYAIVILVDTSRKYLILNINIGQM